MLNKTEMVLLKDLKKQVELLTKAVQQLTKQMS